MFRTWSVLGFAMALWGLCLSSVSCSNGSHDDADGSTGGNGSGYEPGATPTSDTYCSAFAAAYCHALFECPLPANDDVLFLVPVLRTEEDCASHLGAALCRTRAMRDLRQKVEAGQLSFQADNAQVCLNASANCGATGDGIDSCLEVFEGASPAGGPCQRNEDCLGNAFCNLEAGCPGSCVGRLPLGSECPRIASNPCDSSVEPAFCGGSTDTPVCAPISPGAAQEGEPCSTGSASPGLNCQLGLWCDELPDSSEGTCRAPIPPGGACDDADDVCAEHTVCLQDESGNGLCGSINLVSVEGEACSPADSVANAVCDPLLNLACENSVCVKLGDGSLGSRCSNSDMFETMCDDGLYCARQEEAATCQPVVPAGESCEDSKACEWDCDRDTQTCRAEYCAI